MKSQSNIRFLFLLGMVLLVWNPVALVSAQFHEDFESAVPSWLRRETDCVIQDANWNQRRFRDLQTRNQSEKIHFKNGPGTQILVSHAVDPSVVISELVPSVRIKSTRPGVQLLVRVVLPHTPSPSGNGSMTTMLPGPRYRATGKWEVLSFADNPTDLQEQLQEEIWLLRRKFGSHVIHRDAYVDKVVLNLYTGAGETTVQVDDLKISGMVSAESIASNAARHDQVIRDSAVRPASAVQEAGKHKSLVVRDGSVLLVKKQPFFPRIVQHNGEPFNYLSALGFNTIELRSTATFTQLREAQKLDLWLICPPPASVGINPIEFHFDRVLAWKLGEGLSQRDVPMIQQRIREIRQSDKRIGRPVIANLSADWSQLSQLTDIVSLGLQPIGSSFLASQYSDWIAARRSVGGNGKPVWADIQTEMSPTLEAQIGTLAQKSPPIPVEPQQIKFLVFEAIAGGSRGLRFRSRSRLDGDDPVTRLRAQTIQWALAELNQIEPWAVGGALMGEVPTGDDQLEVTAFKTNRSRLLLIQRPTHHEQYLAGDVPVKSINFVDPTTNSTDLAYLVGDAALVPLPNHRRISGTQIQIDDCPFVAAVVLTQDPLVLNKLSQGYERIGQQSILQLHQELTQQWLAIMQLIDRQMGRMGRSSSSGSAALNQAVTTFRAANQSLTGNSAETASKFLNQTDQQLAFMRREIITGPLGMFQSKTSTPFTVHCSLIPLHWELVNRLGAVQWNPNGLPGGDFENLQHMMANGWENRRLDTSQVGTKVELSEAAAVDGEYGLRLSVSEKSAPLGLVNSTPLWITTPGLQVKGGQLVRIHGWVNVANVIRGSHDGLTITDTLGGEEMMERIPVTNGWQEFTLYRGVPTNRTVRVTFALTGIGDVLLDEVTIRTIDLPAPTERQARR